MGPPPNDSPQDMTAPARFLKQASLEEVENLLAQHLNQLSSQDIPLPEAAGRVLAQDIASPLDIPLFDRAAMDGYAVRSDDLASANATTPVTLEVAGRSLPNHPFATAITRGRAIAITTGAPLPADADAVVKQEDVTREADTIVCRASLPPWRHISRRGEDIKSGEQLLSAGRILRPQDLGLLASIGIAKPNVIKVPRVSILVTGNEILPQGAKPTGYQVVDSSSVMLRALVARDGGVAEDPIYVPDHPDAIKEAMMAAAGDIVLVTGGTSVGSEDFAPRVLQEIGTLHVHGVRIRPAHPIGIGLLRNRPVFLLPGNPFSCLCAYDLVVRLAVQRLGGRPCQLPYQSIQSVAGATLPGALGRWDYVRVLIKDQQVFPFPKGAGSGASVLSSSVRADGFALLSSTQADVIEGSPVHVYLYDSPVGTL